MTPLEELVDYVVENSYAVIVQQEGSADDLIEKLTDEGWTLEDTVEVGGKRVRTMIPPEGWWKDASS